jgi:hypothetical protein
MKYYNGHITRSAFGPLKESDACTICGAKHFSNRLTTDGNKVCESCFDKDMGKEIVELPVGE